MPQAIETRAREKISAIVTTFNEERDIADCIESLLWCDEILVVDSFSTDRTPEIVRAFPAHVQAAPAHLLRLGRAEELGDGPHRQRLDPDLRRRRALHAGAAERDRGAARRGAEHSSYTIRRRVYFLDRHIRFSGWQHDQVVRLVRRGSAATPTAACTPT